jgi:hypothetical protein
VSRARGRRTAAVLAVVAGLAAPAAGHWVTPEAIVAELNAEATRTRWGVEQATRDAKVPRLLIIRVGPRWYALPAAARRDQALEWRERWRHNVPQGVVSVLDAASDAPVVRYEPGGKAAVLTDPPKR